MKYSASTFILILCAYAGILTQDYAHAVEDIGAPVPTSRKSLIRSIDRDIEQTREQKEAAQSELQDTSRKMEQLRGKLVAIGKDIKNSENKLNHFDRALAELESKKTKLTADIKSQKAALAEVILATQRLKRTPPVTVLLTPGEPLTTAQTSMIMRSRLQLIESKRKSLRNTLQEYQNTQDDIAQKRESALALKENLDAQYQKLSGLMEQRQKHYARQKIMLAEYTSDLNAMAAKAKDLKELVETIETRNQKIAFQNTVKTIMLPSDQLPAHGAYQLPVSGFIRTRYGAEDRFGGVSQGYEIESYKGALVVAPFSGQIKYAGPFKNFKNLVIIEHRDGYHSLIGGLEKTEVNVGQIIVSGEAIGTLGSAASTSDTHPRGELYYELRHNGKPVNPATKLSDLG